MFQTGSSNCFHKAGFLISVPAAPEPEWNIWDNLQRVFDVQVPFETHATADDNVETSERLSKAEIVDVVRKWYNQDRDD